MVFDDTAGLGTLKQLRLLAFDCFFLVNYLVWPSLSSFEWLARSSRSVASGRISDLRGSDGQSDGRRSEHRARVKYSDGRSRYIDLLTSVERTFK